jgi:hypothetical protein
MLAYEHGVKLAFIRPVKPMENAAIESFDGRSRDEWLNAKVFLSLHLRGRRLKCGESMTTAGREQNRAIWP